MKLITVLLVSIVVIQVSGLKCYECERCKKGNNGKLVYCGETYKHTCRRDVVSIKYDEISRNCDSKTGDRCVETTMGYPETCFCNTDGCNGEASGKAEPTKTMYSYNEEPKKSSTPSNSPLIHLPPFISLIAVVTIPLYMY